MASEMVKAATSDKLKEMDWAKNIEICELVAQDPGKAKDVIKSVKKCIGSRSKTTQLFAVMLLEMLLNNCGEPVHRQVIDNGLLPILVKIVKKKTDLPVREKIFLLLDATQTSLFGAKARFPQYYEAYYELVSAGVQFSNRPNVLVTRAEVPVPETRTEPNNESLSTRLTEAQHEVHTQLVPDASYFRIFAMPQLQAFSSLAINSSSYPPEASISKSVLVVEILLSSSSRKPLCVGRLVSSSSG